MPRPPGSGRNLSVTATLRLTPTEAAHLRTLHGSLPRALRAAVNMLLDETPPPPTPATPRARIVHTGTPPASLSPSSPESPPVDIDDLTPLPTQDKP